MLLVIHVPKTAGTSLRLALQKRFGLSRVARDYGENSEFTTEFIKKKIYNDQSNFDIANILRELEEAGYSVLVGHFPLQKYGRYFNQEKCITFVREPLLRSCSEFMHKVGNGTFTGPFSEFIEIPSQQNLQARILRGASDDMFIGITEQYRVSLRLINEQFNLNLKFKKVNVGQSGGGAQLLRSLPQAVVDRFYELNIEDCNLYHVAVKRLEEIGQKKKPRKNMFNRIFSKA